MNIRKHKMKLRKKEKYRIKYVTTARLRNSPVEHMKIQLNKHQRENKKELANLT